MSKKVIIIGASSGIGLELTRKFYDEGFDVGIAARREEKLMELKQQLKGKGKMEFEAMDIAQYDAVPEKLSNLIDKLGGLDIFIANAGITDVLPIGKGLFEKSKKIVEVNLIGVISCIEVVAEYFRPLQKGHIVGVSSVSAFRGIPGSAAYSASKAGLSNYLDAAGMELMKKNITVSAVHPGWIDTDLYEGMENRPFVLSVEKAVDVIYKGIIKKDNNIILPAFPYKILRFILPYLPQKIAKKII